MTGQTALTNLLAAYFHEDLAHEYSSPLAAVDDFADSEFDYAPQLHDEVHHFLSTVDGDGQLADKLHALGLYYIPTADGWPSYRDWLLDVVRRVDERLAEHGRG